MLPPTLLPLNSVTMVTNRSSGATSWLSSVVGKALIGRPLPGNAVGSPTYSPVTGSSRTIGVSPPPRRSSIAT